MPRCVSAGYLIYLLNSWFPVRVGGACAIPTALITLKCRHDVRRTPRGLGVTRRVSPLLILPAPSPYTLRGMRAIVASVALGKYDIAVFFCFFCTPNGAVGLCAFPASRRRRTTRGSWTTQMCRWRRWARGSAKCTSHSRACFRRRFYCTGISSANADSFACFVSFIIFLIVVLTSNRRTLGRFDGAVLKNSKSTPTLHVCYLARLRALHKTFFSSSYFFWRNMEACRALQ